MIKKFAFFVICLITSILVLTPISVQDVWEWKDSPKESYDKVTKDLEKWTAQIDLEQEFKDLTADIESFLTRVEWKYPSTEEAPPKEASTGKEIPASEASLQDYEPGEFEQEVLRLVNEERTKRGLDPLEMNNRLSGLAAIKSKDMSQKNYFSHTSPTYGSPFEMMNAFDFNYRAAGENIAAGQRTPEQVMEGWMNSEGHRANILNETFTQLGVGYVEGSGPYYTYWTQLFMTPR